MPGAGESCANCFYLRSQVFVVYDAGGHPTTETHPCCAFLAPTTAEQSRLQGNPSWVRTTLSAWCGCWSSDGKPVYGQPTTVIGAQGPPGSKGDPGAAIPGFTISADAPTGGSDNDLWIVNTPAFTLYQKRDGVWESILTIP